MSDHTPGPWEARETAEDVPFPAGVFIAVHRAGDGSRLGRICEMVGQGENGVYSPAVSNANALLIAAAPETKDQLDQLLIAAKECIELFEAWRDGIFAHNGIKWVEEPPAIQLTRSVIAKIEARQ